MIDWEMVFVALNKVDGPHSDFMDNFRRKQISDGFHEGWLCKSSLGCLFWCSIIESLSYRVTRYCLLHVMSELAEQLMVQANSPILTQKLNNVRDQSVVISFADFVQVFIGQPDERHEWRHHNLLTTKIRDILDHSIGINREFNVMPFEILNVFGDELLAPHSFLKDNLREWVLCLFDMVVDHISKQCATYSDWHMQFG